MSALLADVQEQLSEPELARLAQEGDEAAFAEIVRRYSPRVFRFASRLLRHPAQVEEAAQEVFLKAWMQLRDYQGRGSLAGWLTRITTNTCLNMLRSARRHPETKIADLTEAEQDWIDNQMADVALDRQRSHEAEFIAADLADRVLETMSPDDRLVLTLIDGAGASIRETAEMTGWSEAKVKVQTLRARRRMQAAVATLLADKNKAAKVAE